LEGPGGDAWSPDTLLRASTEQQADIPVQALCVCEFWLA
jgi:hypothetical protein